MWGGRKEGALAFRREALAYVDRLHSFARYLSGNDGDAEDLVQETYARAFAAEDTFAMGSNVKAWLYRILRNLFIDRYRREAAGPIATEVDADQQADRAAMARDVLDVDAVTAADVEAAMRALPEASRTVVLLDLEGFSESETAAILGCAAGTVKSRLSRARAALRTLLDEYAPLRRLHGL